MIAIIGPTASGKSSLGRFFSDNFNFSVVNFDSCQLCSGFEVLKATPADLTEHYLYGVCASNASINAVQWANLALDVVSHIKLNNRSPLLIGGTALYLKVFFEGINELPAVSLKIEQFVEEMPLDLVKNQLFHVDPLVLDRFFDARRLRRALVFFLSHHYSILEAYNLRRIYFWTEPFQILALIPPKDILHKNIYQRLTQDFDAMVEQVKEASVEVPTLIGFSEIQALLKGEIEKEQCLELIFMRTKQYAKRQVTFIKHSFKKALFFDSDASLANYFIQHFI